MVTNRWFIFRIVSLGCQVFRKWKKCLILKIDNQMPTHWTNNLIFWSSPSPNFEDWYLLFVSFGMIGSTSSYRVAPSSPNMARIPSWSSMRSAEVWNMSSSLSRDASTTRPSLLRLDLLTETSAVLLIAKCLKNHANILFDIQYTMVWVTCLLLT